MSKDRRGTRMKHKQQISVSTINECCGHPSISQSAMIITTHKQNPSPVLPILPDFSENESTNYKTASLGSVSLLACESTYYLSSSASWRRPLILGQEFCKM